MTALELWMWVFGQYSEIRKVEFRPSRFISEMKEDIQQWLRRLIMRGQELYRLVIKRC
jgi:hypothetical protein